MVSAVTILTLGSVLFPGLAFSPPSGRPAERMIVTVEGRDGKPAPEVRQEDVRVFSGKTRLPVRAWDPAPRDQQGLELYVVIDDALGGAFASLVPDVRKFIESMPPGAAIGLAYMQHGSAVIAQKPTTDHTAAAARVRLPLSSPGISASPYMALEDLLKNWPANAPRREVLMLTDGIDDYATSYPDDPYEEQAEQQAERAGVVVYAIYAGGTGHEGHTFWRVNWGQTLLSRLADGSGGEAFMQGLQTPVSLQPFLQELSGRLNHQYLLAFEPAPAQPGSLEPVRVRTEVPGAELVAARKVPAPNTEQ